MEGLTAPPPEPRALNESEIAALALETAAALNLPSASSAVTSSLPSESGPPIQSLTLQPPPPVALRATGASRQQASGTGTETGMRSRTGVGAMRRRMLLQAAGGGGEEGVMVLHDGAAGTQGATPLSSSLGTSSPSSLSPALPAASLGGSLPFHGWNTTEPRAHVLNTTNSAAGWVLVLDHNILKPSSSSVINLSLVIRFKANHPG
jgi:hypothetical protein